MNRAMGLGFLFFVALVILGFGTLMVGDLGDLLNREKAFLRIRFAAVQGLRKGDDVRVEGVLYGKVKDLELDPNNGVLVTARLDKSITLYQDTEITVDPSSVLGGTFISIKRGSQPPAQDLSQPLMGHAKAGFQEIGDLAAENRENLRQMIANLKDVSQALKDGRGTIGQAIQSPKLHDEAIAVLQEARAAIAEVKKVGERLNTDKIDAILGNVEKASGNLKQITDTIQSGQGPLGKLVNNKEMGEKLEKTVENIEKASDSIKNITGKIERGEGTLGRLTQDEELYEKAKQTIDDIDKTFGKAARSLVEIVTESKYYEESQLLVSKIGLRVTPSEDEYFYVGAAFLGLNKKGDILFKNLVEDDQNDTEIKPEVQIAYRVPWFLDRRITVRGGLIEGKPGGGVDFLWDDWGFFHHPVLFTFEGRDAYNDLKDEDIDERLDGPLLRFGLKTPLWTRKDTWYELLLSTVRLYGGLNRIGDDPEYFWGIGLEWSDENIKTLVGLVGAAR